MVDELDTVAVDTGTIYGWNGNRVLNLIDYTVDTV